MESKGPQSVFSGSTIYTLKFLKQFASWKWFNSQGSVTIFACPKKRMAWQKGICQKLFHAVSWIVR